MAKKFKIRRKRLGKLIRKKKKSLMSGHNRLNFLGTKPTLIKLSIDVPLYLYFLNGSSLGSITGTAGAVTQEFNCFNSLSTSTAFDRYAQVYNMFQVKAITLSYRCGLTANSTTVAGGVQYNLNYVPEFFFLLMPDNTTNTSTPLWSLPGTMKVKGVNYDKTYSKTYALPDNIQYINGAAITAINYGSKTWWVVSNFVDNYATLNPLLGPAVRFGTPENATLDATNGSGAGITFALGTLKLDYWLIFARPTIPQAI